jgi:hypothetical protein
MFVIICLINQATDASTYNSEHNTRLPAATNSHIHLEDLLNSQAIYCKLYEHRSGLEFVQYNNNFELFNAAKDICKKGLSQGAAKVFNILHGHYPIHYYITLIWNAQQPKNQIVKYS